MKRFLLPVSTTVTPHRFVISVMTERYVQPPVLDYHVIYKQSTENTPIVFVLSPGERGKTSNLNS